MASGADTVDAVAAAAGVVDAASMEAEVSVAVAVARRLVNSRLSRPTSGRSSANLTSIFLSTPRLFMGCGFSIPVTKGMCLPKSGALFYMVALAWAGYLGRLDVPKKGHLLLRHDVLFFSERMGIWAWGRFLRRAVQLWIKRWARGTGSKCIA